MCSYAKYRQFKRQGKAVVEKRLVCRVGMLEVRAGVCACAYACAQMESCSGAFEAGRERLQSVDRQEKDGIRSKHKPNAIVLHCCDSWCCGQRLVVGSGGEGPLSPSNSGLFRGLFCSVDDWQIVTKRRVRLCRSACLVDRDWMCGCRQCRNAAESCVSRV